MRKLVIIPLFLGILLCSATYVIFSKTTYVNTTPTCKGCVVIKTTTKGWPIVFYAEVEKDAALPSPIEHSRKLNIPKLLANTIIWTVVGVFFVLIFTLAKRAKGSLEAR